MSSTPPYSAPIRYAVHPAVGTRAYALDINWVIQGDCLRVLPSLPARCADLIFADPPYNLQLRQELWRPNRTRVDAVSDAWDRFTDFAEYDAFTRAWLTECRRVLKDRGTLWVIGTYHNVYRIGAILQDLGFWILNDVVWIKCLAATTRVYAKTPRGERPMAIHDLVAVDPAVASLWNGQKWSRILGFQAGPVISGIELVLRSGEKIRCTPNHLWPTQRGLVKASDLVVGDVIDTCLLPEPEAGCSHPGLDDDLVGWFIGTYLADGSRHEDTITITSHIDETRRFALLCEIASAYHGSCTREHTKGKCCRIDLNGRILNAIIDTYIGGRTAKDKHLSLNCWGRSNRFLTALLRGYLEGDGSYHEERKIWGLGFTENRRLESDLRTLCARIGANLRLKPRTIRSTNHSLGYLNDREFHQFYGTLRCEKSLPGNYKCDSEVVRLDTCPPQAYYDIAVEDAPHLFALASGILTHNSNPMPQFRGVRFCNAHEELIWAAKSEKLARGYTFNYHELKAMNGGKQMRSDWYFPLCGGQERLRDESGRKLHSTQKPLALLERIVLACSRPGDLVIDPFAGTGTTGVAAHRHGRRFLMIEREERYVELGIRRRLPPTSEPAELHVAAGG